MVLFRLDEGNRRKYNKALRARLKMWFPWVAFLSVAVTILLVAEHNIAPGFRKCVSEISRQQATKHARHKGLIIRDIVTSQSICSISLIDRHNGFFSFLTALAVAFFTGTLWTTSKRQSDLTQQSIDLARREFIAAHKPIAEIQDVSLEVLQPEQAAVVSVKIYNGGNSRIAAIYIWADLRLARDKLEMVQQTAPPLIDVPTGYTRHFKIFARRAFSWIEIYQIEQSAVDLLLDGVVNFWDENDTQRTVTFRYLYKPARKTFLARKRSVEESDDLDR